jgi:uncharacterized protein with ATP-grasp and redox domains
VLNSYLRLAESGAIPADRQEDILRRLLELLSRADYSHSPPVLGRLLHRLIRESLKDPDPYRLIKVKYNKMMLDMYPSFVEMVQKSDDPFDTAMRLAVAGNSMDFASQYQLDVMDTLNQVLEAGFFIDDSEQLRESLGKASSLLYIGDNCGEIVLDKLFLEFINLSRMYFVVRNGPVINDATLSDAEMTGVGKVAKVITTGDDAPGAVWESASGEFRDHFHNADVIISKGQGNLEGLIDIPHDQIYFMFLTKCDLIARRVGAGKEQFIVKKGDRVKNLNL